jgi:hypothetical protein
MTDNQKHTVLMAIFHTTSGRPFIPESEYDEFPAELQNAIEEIASPSFVCMPMGESSIWVLFRENDDESELLDAIGYADRCEC